MLHCPQIPSKESTRAGTCVCCAYPDLSASLSASNLAASSASGSASSSSLASSQVRLRRFGAARFSPSSGASSSDPARVQEVCHQCGNCAKQMWKTLRFYEENPKKQVVTIPSSTKQFWKTHQHECCVCTADTKAQMLINIFTWLNVQPC